MSGVIQRFPLGLLDFLGLKSTGDAPHVMPDSLSPVLDLGALYRANKWELLTAATANIGATGNNGAGNWQVPAGELWVVDNLAIQASANLGAATTMRCRISLYNVQTGNLFDLSNSVASGTVGERPGTGFEQLVILRPNEGAGVYCEAWTAGGVALAWTIVGRVAKYII